MNNPSDSDDSALQRRALPEALCPLTEMDTNASSANDSSGNDYAFDKPFVERLKHWTGGLIKEAQLGAVQAAICHEAYNSVTKSGSFKDEQKWEKSLANYDQLVKDIFRVTGLISPRHRKFFDKLKGSQSKGMVTGKCIQKKSLSVSHGINSIRNEILPYLPSNIAQIPSGKALQEEFDKCKLHLYKSKMRKKILKKNNISDDDKKSQLTTLI